MTAFYERIGEVPLVFDLERAKDVLSTLAAAFSQNEALQPAAALLASGEGKTEALLAAAFSGAPYLASLALRDPAILAECLLQDPDVHLAAAVTTLSSEMALCANAKDASALLRRFKRSMALLVGLADLGGVWPIDGVLTAISGVADAAVATSVDFLLRSARAAGQIGEAFAPGNGYFVIAMGKLGASELNYSSDIDIIVFYELDQAGVAPSVEPSTFFVRLTRELVRLLQEHTGEGYVFRTDLRLRPDPGATQIALSTDAALSYYESFAQNWERAALIKARVVAGDFEAGNDFLRQLSPFIWRRYLDYAAIADIHAMKRRVHAFKGHGAVAVAGHDIKLGRGGIRDIEFFVQTQQLIAGGRHRELRVRGTIEGLQRLAAGGWISADAARELAASYRFLRRIENRLQMIGDQQTHRLPSDTNGLRRIAYLAGFADTERFGEAVLAQLRTVEHHYNRLFEKLPELPDAGPRIAFAGKENDPAELAALEQLGFRNPVQAVAAVRAWQSGRYPATRSDRARERLTSFLPLLLEAFGRTADPDLALATFDKVIAEMPAGVQLFSLLAANPSLLRLIADIMGTAPRLARIVGLRPRLLDAVLDPGFFGSVPSPEMLEALVYGALAEAADYSDALDRARIVGREQAFLIGVRVLSGTISAEQAGAAYADLAALLIDALAKRVEAELERQHGKVPGGRAAIIAMGKLGGREMTATSDLDLIVVYDFEGEHAQSDGPKPLAGSQFYSRFTQRLISALAAPTPEGSLYQVDMRLRPSGSQGPVATRLSSFIDYQESSAWTWEHLALTRARVISGPADLRERIEATIDSVLAKPRDQFVTAAAVKTMRGKIDAEKGTKDIWDLKYVRGGLVDAEFLTQFLEITHAHSNPHVLEQNTSAALGRLAEARILAPQDADILIPAVGLYHTVTQVLRLSLDRPFVPDEAPRGLKDLLARAAELPDFQTLTAVLTDTLNAVRDCFERIVQ